MSTAPSVESAFSNQAGFARIAQALADPAREAMVAALGDGQARPAGELAAAAGVSAQGASAHLHKLVTAGILSVWAQGRFRYYRIADEEVAALVESLVNLAARPAPRAGRRRVAPELEAARSCYHHLAGRLGVALAAALVRCGHVRVRGTAGAVTAAGEQWCRRHGIAFNGPADAAVRLCPDWTERKPHFAGPLGTALLDHLLRERCLVRRQGQRGLRVTEKGRAFFASLGISAAL
jgi:DNA-binding transcriptional ArsR family regulator